MTDDFPQYPRILTRLQSARTVLTKAISRSGTVRALSFTGLGTGHAGKVLTRPLCANTTGRGIATIACPNAGVFVCAQCTLVKYCSERCQRQNWSRHRIHCDHELRRIKWRPSWVTEGRTPRFAAGSGRAIKAFYSLWNTGPTFDCLGLRYRISSDDLKLNLKICFPAGSLSHLVKTINNLPREFQGQCDILLNHVDAVVINRHLITLYTLLRSGGDVEESAELATHLIYSAFLTPPCAEYLSKCIEEIYGLGPREGDMSFHSSLETRGVGKLQTMQTTMGIKRPVEMATSTYGLTKARRSLHEALLHLSRIDDRERFLMKLRPAHRLALSRFWETGVLAPFFLNTVSFSQPNRLHFSPQGEWLGHPNDANPLRGWDVATVRMAGVSRGLDPADILGCLFFHVKSELVKFASRLQELCVNIYFTQFDVRVLSKGICSGLLPAFERGCFDRIDAGDLMDNLGIQECLTSLVPLINPESPGACILMHSRTWYHQIPCAVARDNPRLLKILITKAEALPRLQHRLKKANITQTGQAPEVITSTSLLRMIDYLDAFVDHEPSFRSYLAMHNTASVCKSLGLQQRDQNHHHPKRFGISVDHVDGGKQDQPQVPGRCLTKEEFYDLVVLSSAELPTRFIEFEPLPIVSDADRQTVTSMDSAPTVRLQ